MKRITFVIALAIVSHLKAQHFVNSFEVALPDSISESQVKWADVDNDGLLDIVVLGFGGTSFDVFIYKSDTVSGFQYQNHVATMFTSVNWSINDVDEDNDVDIALSGISNGSGVTSFLINDGFFNFHGETISQENGNLIRFADVTRDGKNEMILANDAVKIFRQEGNMWTLLSDTITIQASAIEVFDVDHDGDKDIFVSGKRGSATVTEILLSDDGAFSRVNHGHPIDGTAMVADLNHDGSLDIVAAGVGANGNFVNRVYSNNGGLFVARDTIFQNVNSKVFAADFDSDGRCDLQFISNQINRIFFSNANQVDLPLQGVLDQKCGDFDKDGDLDVVQIINDNGIKVAKLLENTSLKNMAPGVPQNPVGFSIYDRLFLYWDRPNDDHTPKPAITYDVTLQIESEEVMVADFDLITKKRILVTPGNNGTENFALLNVQSTSFQFSVQAVDNSFHAGGVAQCVGGLPSCSQIVSETLTVCKNQPISLSASPSTLWFSIKHGLIARGSVLDQVVEDTDTVFSFTPSEGGCSSVHVYAIKFGTGIIEKSLSEKFVCAGQVIPFEVEPEWNSVAWSSFKKGFLSNAGQLSFTATELDTVKVLLSNGSGCSIQRAVAVIISRPELQVNGSAIQILRGESVQLSATGGETYSWAPAESLDNPNSPTPTATPLSSTQYSVIATDSIGCTAEGSLMVMVEGTAFIPNLFTPNADGQNDDVKIYGMSEVKTFKFTIHNREGALVYSTEDPQQAVHVGWNGTARGVPQPNGIYYWKVKGEHFSGSRFLLNGKTTGSIVLIR